MRRSRRRIGKRRIRLLVTSMTNYITGESEGDKDGWREVKQASWREGRRREGGKGGGMDDKEKKGERERER